MDQVDKGWAWMCVLGCFLMHVCVMGIFKSMGVLIVEIRTVFDVNTSLVAWIPAIMTGLVCGLSPLANGLAARYGGRPVVMAGGVLYSLGYILGFFAQTVEYLFGAFALVTGVGFSLSYGPSIGVVGQWFEKRRALANGIAVAGSSVGQFVIPPLVRFLIDKYSLRGAFLILGGLSLHITVAGALYRPIKHVERKYTSRDPSSHSVEKTTQCVKQLSDGRSNESNCSTYERGLVLQPMENTEQKDETPLRVCEMRASHPSHPVDNVIHDTENYEHRPPHLTIKPCKPQTRSNSSEKKKKVPIFDFSLLLDLTFVLLFFTNIFGQFSYTNQFLFMPAAAKSIGVDVMTSAMLVSIAGGSDLIGRIVIGVITDYRFMDSCQIMGITLLAGAAASIGGSFATSFAGFGVYTALYGLLGGAFIALYPVTMAEVLGVGRLNHALGLVLLGTIVGSLGGPPTMGMVADTVGNYVWIYRIFGAAMFVASCLDFLLVRTLHKRKTVAAHTGCVN